MPTYALAPVTVMVLLSVLYDAAVPYRWLPLVILRREQRWSLRQVVCVTVLGGLARVASSLLVGITMGTAGEAPVDRFRPFSEAARWAAVTLLLYSWLLGPVALLLLGLWLMFRRGSCRCGRARELGRAPTPDEGGCPGGAGAGTVPVRGSVVGSARDRGNIAAVAGLVMVMLFSPSVELRAYSMYFAGQAWAIVLGVSALWFVAWLSLQLLIVCWVGAWVNRIRYPRFGWHEGAVHGAVLIVLGLLWLFV